MRVLLYIFLTALPLLCPCFGELKAQDVDRCTYMKRVEGQSLLYRGKIEKQYSFKYKGTYFAYQEEYVEGDVYYNKKLYTGVLLNLNSFTDELSVRLSESHLPLLLEKNLVQYFTLGDKPFVNIDSQYYEILVDGDMVLYKKIVKEYREDLVSSGQESKIEKVFDADISYFLVDGTQWTKVSGRGAFIKLYPQYKREIKKVFREATRAERSDKDKLYKRVMEVVR